MNKLAWTGLFISAVGEGFWWGAGFMGKNDISLAGLLVMFGGALILGFAFLKMHIAEKRGFC